MVPKWELVTLKWEGNIRKWEAEVIALSRAVDNRKARKSQANTDAARSPLKATGLFCNSSFFPLPFCEMGVPCPSYVILLP
jgi:hypothetical protein